MAINLETDKTKALAKLAQQFPGQQQDTINQSMASNVSQLQASLGAAPTQIQDVASAAQKAGGTFAGAQVAARQQAQQQLGAQAQTMGQIGMQAANIAGQKQLAEQQSAMSQKSIDFANRLAKLDENTKDQLLDQQIAFQKDKRGKAFLNDRQLMDYAVTHAKNAQEFQTYAESIQRASQRQIAMWETAAKKLGNELERQLQMGESAQNQQLKRDLAQLKMEAEKKAANAKRKAANRAAMFQTVGTVAGIGAGAMTGTPQGAMIGGQLGGAAGTLAASQTGE
jgi:hypothetical protein